MNEARIKELKNIANDVRIGIIDATHAAKCGHPGGSLSIADILTYLYFADAIAASQTWPSSISPSPKMQ